MGGIITEALLVHKLAASTKAAHDRTAELLVKVGLFAEMAFNYLIMKVQDTSTSPQASA